MEKWPENIQAPEAPPKKERKKRGKCENKKLTQLQQRFVQEFLKDKEQNAVEAAKRAGYGGNNIAKVVHDLMKKPHIQAAINWAMEERAKRCQIDQDTVLREIAFGAFYDVGELVKHAIREPADIAKLPLQYRKVIKGWKWDKFGNFLIELESRRENLELLGKHLKLFNQQIEIKTPDKPKPPTPEEAMELLMKQLEDETNIS